MGCVARPGEQRRALQDRAADGDQSRDLRCRRVDQPQRHLLRLPGLRHLLRRARRRPHRLPRRPERGTATGAHYASAKGGVATLTKVFAREVAPSGVTVNVVSPGPQDLPNVRDMLPPDRLRDRRVHSCTAVGEAYATGHRCVATTVRPVYLVQDRRPVAQVLRRRPGSYSRRPAVLEAVARAHTRVLIGACGVRRG
ncbi:SDR family oxidoreductase [Streptomyces sp. cg40]|uniref:SDR family oxidoreductase n=1 Tax=Streptomyces sp. cg40 TaxID=3419764 RepID=UPI003D090C28